MLSYLRVFIDFVLEKRAFELLFSPLVVCEHPIVGEGADKHWHNHWVFGKHVQVLLLKQIESEIVGLLHEINYSFFLKRVGTLAWRLLHLHAQVEHLKLELRVLHQKLLGSLEHLW